MHGMVLQLDVIMFCDKILIINQSTDLTKQSPEVI